jgi:hypothetical protein
MKAKAISFHRPDRFTNASFEVFHLLDLFLILAKAVPRTTSKNIPG